jgi:dimethylhistidine N-methyltransferase
MIAIRQVPLPSTAVDVLDGLTATPKWLPPRLFYDARGSELFEEITRLPEYYLTRTERTIFQAHADDMVAQAGPNLSVFELGAGTATKTQLILRALSSRQRRVTYIPVDVSHTALKQCADDLAEKFPQMTVEPIVADYTSGIARLKSVRGRKLVLYIGSSIGNFELDEAADLLARIREGLRPGDALLLGVDLAKSPDILLPAYDDAQGVTAEFNKNVLRRLNDELSADFDLDRFRHLAVWNASKSRIEMHLESTTDQSVNFAMLGLSVHFDEGETIHTENSYKFTPQMIDDLFGRCGFTLERTWTDPHHWFAEHLARVK